MLRPIVTIYNLISLDGRNGWFRDDYSAVTAYYKIAARWKTDAVLMGNLTLDDSAYPDQEEPESPDSLAPYPTPKWLSDCEQHPKPLLIVLDREGLISNWTHHLRLSWFSDVLVICTKTTPQAYFEKLKTRKINYWICGEDDFDAEQICHRLVAERGIKTLRVDAGGKLIGSLLQKDLVDEVKLLTAPIVVGGSFERNVCESYTSLNPIHLELTSLEEIQGGYILSSHRVLHSH